MAYESSEESKSTSLGPHRDADRNKEYYLRMLDKVIFRSPDVMVPEFKKYHPSYSKIEITIAFGPPGAREGCHVISFHQDHYPFKLELCVIFNTLYSRGFLERIYK